MILSVGLGSGCHLSLVVFFGVDLFVNREGTTKWNVSLSLRCMSSMESIMGCCNEAGDVLGSGRYFMPKPRTSSSRGVKTLLERL